MKKFFLRIIYCGLYYIGIIPLFYRINRDRQRILVFHHIIPDHLRNGSFEQQIVCTAKSEFEWLLGIVNRRFEITTRIGKPATAVVTFDDGYRAAFVADEVLSKFGNPAYFFMPTENVGKGPLWVDRVMSWFAYVPVGTYAVDGRSFELADSASRRLAFSKVMDRLYLSGRYDPADLEQRLNALFPFGELPIDKAYYDLRFRGLTIAELDDLKRKGHKIGGHSVKHDILSCLSSRELAADFETCFTCGKDLYNTSLYAYPFGHRRDVTDRVVAACEKSGFRYAVMNEYVADPTDYTLSRLNISHYATRYEVEAALCGLTQWIKNKVKWIRK